MTDLKVIQGGNKPKPYRKKQQGEAEQVTCPRCDGSAFIEVWLSPMTKGLGKWQGGSKVRRCVHCMTQGVTTDL